MDEPTYKNLEEAILGISVWREYLKEDVKPLSNNIVYKLAFEAEVYHQTVFHRLIELLESAVLLYKADLKIGGISCIRAAHETVSILGYLNIKMERFVADGDIKKILDARNRLFFGWNKEPEFPDKINVITCMESLDKKYGLKLMGIYGVLSEFSHPNYSGVIGVYGEPSKEDISVSLGKYVRSSERLDNIFKGAVVTILLVLELVVGEFEGLVNDVVKKCSELQEQDLLMKALQESEEELLKGNVSK